MKLDIGCGQNREAGYHGVDCVHQQGVEFVANAWSLPFDDGSIDECYSRHMLEHLYPDQAEASLKEWRRVLKPGGKAHVIVPCLEFHCKQLLGIERSNLDHDQSVHAMAGLYGWQGKAGDPRERQNDTHKWGYTKKTMSDLLEKCGFVKITPESKGGCEKWHVNLSGVKP